MIDVATARIPSERVDGATERDVIGAGKGRGSASGTTAGRSLGNVRLPSIAITFVALKFEPAVAARRSCTVHLHVDHPAVRTTIVQRLVARYTAVICRPSQWCSLGGSAVIQSLTRLGTVPIEVVVALFPVLVSRER